MHCTLGSTGLSWPSKEVGCGGDGDEGRLLDPNLGPLTAFRVMHDYCASCGCYLNKEFKVLPPGSPAGDGKEVMESSVDCAGMVAPTRRGTAAATEWLEFDKELNVFCAECAECLDAVSPLDSITPDDYVNTLLEQAMSTDASEGWVPFERMVRPAPILAEKMAMLAECQLASEQAPAPIRDSAEFKLLPRNAALLQRYRAARLPTTREEEKAAEAALGGEEEAGRDARVLDFFARETGRMAPLRSAVLQPGEVGVDLGNMAVSFPQPWLAMSFRVGECGTSQRDVRNSHTARHRPDVLGRLRGLIRRRDERPATASVGVQTDPASDADGPVTRMSQRVHPGAYRCTGGAVQEQTYFSCLTCQTDGAVICVGCAEVSHAGHTLSYAQYGAVACDCTPGGLLSYFCDHICSAKGGPPPEVVMVQGQRQYCGGDGGFGGGGGGGVCGSSDESEESCSDEVTDEDALELLVELPDHSFVLHATRVTLLVQELVAHFGYEQTGVVSFEGRCLNPTTTLEECLVTTGSVVVIRENGGGPLLSNVGLKRQELRSIARACAEAQEWRQLWQSVRRAASIGITPDTDDLLRHATLLPYDHSAHAVCEYHGSLLGFDKGLQEMQPKLRNGGTGTDAYRQACLLYGEVCWVVAHSLNAERSHDTALDVSRRGLRFFDNAMKTCDLDLSGCDQELWGSLFYEQGLALLRTGGSEAEAVAAFYSCLDLFPDCVLAKKALFSHGKARVLKLQESIRRPRFATLFRIFDETVVGGDLAKETKTTKTSPKGARANAANAVAACPPFVPFTPATAAAASASTILSRVFSVPLGLYAAVAAAAAVATAASVQAGEALLAAEALARAEEERRSLAKEKKQEAKLQRQRAKARDNHVKAAAVAAALAAAALNTPLADAEALAVAAAATTTAPPRAAKKKEAEPECPVSLCVQTDCTVKKGGAHCVASCERGCSVVLHRPCLAATLSALGGAPLHCAAAGCGASVRRCVAYSGAVDDSGEAMSIPSGEEGRRAAAAAVAAAVGLAVAAAYTQRRLRDDRAYRKKNVCRAAGAAATAVAAVSAVAEAAAAAAAARETAAAEAQAARRAASEVAAVVAAFSVSVVAAGGKASAWNVRAEPFMPKRELLAGEAVQKQEKEQQQQQEPPQPPQPVPRQPQQQQQQQPHQQPPSPPCAHNTWYLLNSHDGWWDLDCASCGVSWRVLAKDVALCPLFESGLCGLEAGCSFAHVKPPPLPPMQLPPPASAPPTNVRGAVAGGSANVAQPPLAEDAVGDDVMYGEKRETKTKKQNNKKRPHDTTLFTTAAIGLRLPVRCPRLLPLRLSAEKMRRSRSADVCRSEDPPLCALPLPASKRAHRSGHRLHRCDAPHLRRRRDCREALVSL